MDDFVIPADNEQELEERTIKFLKVAEQYNLCFKQTKCEFGVEEVPVLEVRISKGKVQMEEEKVMAVQDWPPPTNVKGVQSFLGFTNFYQQFIKDFSKIA
jgi:hypothetical protein